MSAGPDINTGRGRSYDSFIRDTGLDPAAPGTITDFTQELGFYRDGIARAFGITPDALHINGAPRQVQEDLIAGEDVGIL
jgi:hypothetical protein